MRVIRFGSDLDWNERLIILILPKKDYVKLVRNKRVSSASATLLCIS